MRQVYRNLDRFKMTVPSEAKIRWQCRRGMLELDILLKSFLEKIYPGLSDNEKIDFALFLEHSDNELFEWLTGRHLPVNESFQRIVQQIRSCKQ